MEISPRPFTEFVPLFLYCGTSVSKNLQLDLIVLRYYRVLYSYLEILSSEALNKTSAGRSMTDSRWVREAKHDLYKPALLLPWRCEIWSSGRLSDLTIEWRGFEPGRVTSFG